MAFAARLGWDPAPRADDDSASLAAEVERFYTLEHLAETGCQDALEGADQAAE